jgi:Uma2 family endonuclease
MVATTPDRPKLWTEQEIQNLPDNGYKHEIVNGELIMSPKNNFEHERLVGRLYYALETFVRAHKNGAVLTSNLGYWMRTRNCRAPDISFIRTDRLRKHSFNLRTRKFFPEAPDLAIEVISASNTGSEIDSRMRDLFSSGTELAWIIHPDEQFVEVCHSLSHRKLVGPGGELDGEELLPGFRYKIDDLFAPEYWER